MDKVAISDVALMHELNKMIIQESERQTILLSKDSVSQIISTSISEGGCEK